MSYCDTAGAQLEPNDLVAAPVEDDHLTVDDLRAIASAVMHDRRLGQDEQLRLSFALMELAHVGGVL